MPSCLITGATGAIGPATVAAFRNAGYSVRALARHGVPTQLLGDDVEMVTGDLLDPAAVARAVRGVDVVVHLAALLHITNPPPELAGEYERCNVEGTRMVAGASIAAGVRRLVYFSTIAVYGSATQKPWTETTEPRPDNAYARTKLAAEREVLAVQGTVLRMAAVYGPGVKGNYRRLVKALDRRISIAIGPGSNRRSVIYDKDAAAAAVIAATHPAAPGEIFNVTDGTSPTVTDIVAAICAALGRRPPRLHLPLLPVRATARIIESITRLPIPALIEKYTEDVTVDDQKIRNVLGFRASYDQQRGWADTVRRMCDAGHLR